MQACHREGVDVATVTQRVAAVAPLHLEAELAVQRDRRGVVDVDGELCLLYTSDAADEL